MSPEHRASTSRPAGSFSTGSLTEGRPAPAEGQPWQNGPWRLLRFSRPRLEEASEVAPLRMPTTMTTRSKSLAAGLSLREAGRRGARLVFDRLSVVALLLQSILLCEVAFARTLDVPAGYPTIQSAVDSAEDGDLVLVAPGAYFERVVIPGTALTLASHFYVTGDPTFIDQTVIDGFGRLPDGSFEDGSFVVRVVAGSSTGPSRIVGLTLTHAKRGVEAFDRAEVLYTTITETNDAVHLQYGSSGLVRACTLYGNRDDGVDINKTAWGKVEHSRIFLNNGDGIEIRLPSSDGPPATYEIRNNAITENRDDGIQIISVDQSGPPMREFVIEGNLIADNLEAGVGLMCCGNSNEDFSGAAIPGRILFHNNTLRSNADGMTGGDNLIAVNNLFIGHGVALKRLRVDSIAAHNLFFANVTDFLDAQVDLGSTLTGIDPLLAPDSSLLPGSAAVDAGVAQFTWNGETVLDLAPSNYVGPAPDLGAFELGGNTPLNQPPFVTVGDDQELPAGSVASLAGVVSDDGQPGPLLLTWREVSGTGNVIFSDENSAAITASFLAGGVYELELEADDGDLRSTDRLVVRVGVTGVDAQIMHETDDAEEALSTGAVQLHSSDLEMVFDSSLVDDQIVGLRFAGVGLPPDVGIVDAYVQFWVDEAQSAPTSLIIEAQDDDDALPFVGTVRDLSLRPRLPLNVAWLPPPWSAVGEAGPAQRTPNLAPLLQKIVERPGWIQGNSLVLFVTGAGKRVADSFEGDPNTAPLLHVDYRENTPPTVTITAPPDGSTFSEGDPVTFTGTASDAENGDLSASVAWTSSLDGPLGSGSPLTTTLSLGTHTIAAEVTDSGGLTGADQINVPEPSLQAMIASALPLLALLARRRARRPRIPL